MSSSESVEAELQRCIAAEQAELQRCIPAEGLLPTCNLQPRCMRPSSGRSKKVTAMAAALVRLAFMKGIASACTSIWLPL